MKNKLKFSYDQVYKSCIYAMCAHISSIPRLSLVSSELSWDGINFSFRQSIESEGTVSFDTKNKIIVGAFRNCEVERFRAYPDKEAIEYFSEANDAVRELVNNEALQYCLIGFKKTDTKKGLFGLRKVELELNKPVITTAFWSEGDNIYSADEGALFILNGGAYIANICVPKTKLIEYLKDNYELTREELDFTEKLYELKMNNKSEIKRDTFSGFIDEESEEYGEFVTTLSDFGFKVI